ncbi:MAG: sigma-70 family RNA polymerase sigma factor [Clostridia bacterium]|nr:sigma-70 family RNA polymerase sigma factor [Clostridia bacterium]
MTDEKIIELYNVRDEAALKETKAKYGRCCYSIAYNILHTKEDAEECENDTYLDAWNTIPPQKPRILSSFLCMLTRRISLDRFRKRSADKRGGGETVLSLDELEECIPAGQSIDERITAKELSKTVSEFLSALPRAECDVFMRRYFYFDTVSEICTRYGFSQSKVKMMLKRTRDKLQKHLKKEGTFV